ncbi:iron transporter [Ectobacillus funiculus]|uniref:iron transporter n=1 Tax=Ectobacillus funiculus TaxID=137993 RepID=UPI00397AB0FC
MKKLFLLLTSLVILVLSAACTNQKEQVSGHHEEAGEDVMIGQVVKNGMEIHAVYLPHAVKVAPVERGGKEGNIHLEADIHATKDNSFGFPEGAWIPYLTINYKIYNLDTHEDVEEGQLYQMVAGDPHYASNVLLPEAGNYELTFQISQPDLARHAEDVKEFYEPMTLKWKFKYDGAKK